MDNESNKNSKIVMVSFLVMAMVAGIVSVVIIESLASAPVIGGYVAKWIGLIDRKLGGEYFMQLFPALVGAGLFFGLVFKKSVNIWADEVVVELLKVVWPTKKEVTAMTIVCCVMLIISGLILGAFDFVSTQIVTMIVN